MLQTQCGGLGGKRHMAPTQKMLVARENEQFCPASGCPYGWADNITIYTGTGTVVVAVVDSRTSFRGAPGTDLQHSARLPPLFLPSPPGRPFPPAAELISASPCPRDQKQTGQTAGPHSPDSPCLLNVSTLFT